MKNIHILYSYSVESKKCFQLIKEYEEKIKKQYGLEILWGDLDATFHTRGITGTLKIHSSQIEITVIVAWWLRLFSHQIESGIRKELENLLHNQ